MSTIKQIGIKTGNIYDYRDIAVESGNIEWAIDGATTSTHLTQDGAGQVIYSTYLKDIEKNGDNIKLVYGNGTKSADIAVGKTYSTFDTSNAGLVPAASSSGDTTKYLRGDGTWQAVSSANDTYVTLKDGNSQNISGLTITNESSTGEHSISLSNSGATAGSYGPSDAVTQTQGGTINVPSITVDAYGRVTNIANKTLTMKLCSVSGTGLSKNSSNQISLGNHASTATTYGLGTDVNYGHVKLLDTMTGASTAAVGGAQVGVAASAYALYLAYNNLNSRITAIETGQTPVVLQVDPAVEPTANGAIWIVTS